MPDPARELRIEYVDPDSLRPFDGNPRTITEAGLEKLQRSVEEFGFTNPILAQAGTRMVIAGHQRLKAAQAAGLTEVPVVWLDMDDVTAKAYNMADNRLAEEAEWDATKRDELLQALDGEGFDLSLIGFDPEELESLFASPGPAGDDFNPSAEMENITEPRCTPGEVWALGRHRIACGDAVSQEIWERLLDGEPADLVVTSPPYNVGVQYRTYEDSREREEYLALIEAAGRQAFHWLKPGRFVAWNVGVSPNSFPHYHVVTLEGCGFRFYRQIVWEKAGVPYPIFSSTMRSKRARHYKPNYKHEVVYLLESPGEASLPEVECPVCEGGGRVQGHVSPVAHDMLILATSGEPELGEKVRPTKKFAHDVWHIHQAAATTDLPTVGDRSSGLEHGGKKTHRVKAHPAAFPVELPVAVMTFLAAPGERVIDPFVGAGATIMAAEQLGRTAYGIELEPAYCELSMRRWEKATGETAQRAG